MISDVEHFFLYPLAICIFSGKNICLVPFLNQVDCYIISIIYILYIFWRLSLIRYTCCKHFLPVYRLPFHFVDYFAVQKYFNLYSHLLIFLFYFFFFFCQLGRSGDTFPLAHRQTSWWSSLHSHQGPQPFLTAENFICPCPDIFPLFSRELMTWYSGCCKRNKSLL